MATTTTTTTRQVITLSDLSKHNDRADCWIAVHSKVWDITHFINEHPGGPDSMFFFHSQLEEPNC